MPNKEGSGASIQFLIFPDPYGGHQDLFRTFESRRYFSFKYYLFFHLGNQQFN